MTDAKGTKKHIETHLISQNTDEAKSSVMVQRELKNKKDALRKIENRLKTLTQDTPDYTAMSQEVEETRQGVTELERKAANSSAALVAPDAISSGNVLSKGAEQMSSLAAADDLAQEKDLKKQADMRLAGQDSEEARVVVKLQRELKRKKDSLRKLQKKLKTMNPDTEGYNQARVEESQLAEEIATMEARGGDFKSPAAFGFSSLTNSVAAPSTLGITQVAATSSNNKIVPTADNRKVLEDGENDIKENRAKLQDLVRQAIQDNNYWQLKQIMPRQSVVHPCVAEVVVMVEEMLIVGGNARTMAMIYAFREMLKSTSVLTGSSLKDVDTTAFEKLIEENYTFLRRRREASAGMRYVKEALVRRLVALRDNEEPLGDPHEVALQLINAIEAELRMFIKTIVEDRSLPYVSCQDTILVFGRSSVVEFILLSRVRDRHRCPKRVIVLDSGPLFEGRGLAHRLSEAGIQVTYGLITACCTLMPKCTKVFIGAAAVLQSGDVFGRCGSALVAACAKSFRKSVLCFAESYKFVAEVWIGNLAQNTKLLDVRELFPNESSNMLSPTLRTSLHRFPSINPWHRRSMEEVHSLKTATPATNTPSSEVAGYLYDLTPAVYVDMIICEMGSLHTSAIIAAIKDREGREASSLSCTSNKV